MMNETEFVSEDIVVREIASLAPEDVTRIRKAAQRWRPHGCGEPSRWETLWIFL